jgi:hypothetical protein
LANEKAANGVAAAPDEPPPFDLDGAAKEAGRRRDELGKALARIQKEQVDLKAQADAINQQLFAYDQIVNAFEELKRAGR